MQERARVVLAELLRAQPELASPEQELESTAELVRTGMAGLALWWIDHPTVPRPVLVDLVTRMIRVLTATAGRCLARRRPARSPR